MLEKIKEKKIFFQKLAGRLTGRRLLFIAALFVVGLVFWRLVIYPRNKDVKTHEVKKDTVSEILILSGEVKALEHANLRFQSSGEITWVGVSEGDKVKKGQALARLDTRSLYAAHQQAKADLRNAQATLDRVYDDVKGHDTDETFTQKETRTAAEIAKDKAYWALQIAEENLANAVLTAPFDGVVAQITNPFTGMSVLYTKSQFEVVNPETVYFEVTADQNDVNKLKEGQKVNITIDPLLNKEFEGEVVHIGYTPITGEIGSMYAVKVEFLDEVNPLELRVGMTGDAKFILSRKENVLSAPTSFVNTDKKGEYVNKGDKDNKVYIEIGIEGEDNIEVKEGVKEGDILYD